MPKGGYREGAGRKKGQTGNGRKARLKAALHLGHELPLDYMLRTLRDESVEPSRRDDMAKAAAPYFHSKMPQALVTPPRNEAAMTEDDETIIATYTSGIHEEAEQS
jgi:hypothetical protein